MMVNYYRHTYSFTHLKVSAGKVRTFGIPPKIIQKKALALLLSLQQPMRNFILCIAGYSALVNSEGEKRRKKGENKKGSGLCRQQGVCCSHRPLLERCTFWYEG